MGMESHLSMNYIRTLFTYGEKVSINFSGKTMSSLPCEVHVGHWLNQTPKVVHVSGGKYNSS